MESATVPPLTKLESCPACGFQHHPEDDSCDGCGHILKGKACLKCGEEIVRSALACPHCGESQVPVVREPWSCEVCGETNGVDDETCSTCASLRGTPSPVSPAALTSVGEYRDDLSFTSVPFTLANGSKSDDITVAAFQVPSGTLKPVWQQDPVPSIAVKPSIGMLNIYLDLSHQQFAALGVMPEVTVATEVAQYLHTLRADLGGRPGHSVANIASTVLSTVWADRLVEADESLRTRVAAVFARAAEGLEGSDTAVDFCQELTTEEQEALTRRAIEENRLAHLSELLASGKYLQFLPASALARLFSFAPEHWFEHVWSTVLPRVEGVGPMAIEQERKRIIAEHQRCLDACAEYLAASHADAGTIPVVQASCSFLEERIR